MEPAPRDKPDGAVNEGPAPPPKPQPELSGAPGSASAEEEVRRVLDRLPTGILIHRGEQLLFANRSLIDLAGYADFADLADQGGVGQLFRGRSGSAPAPSGETGSAVDLVPREGEPIQVEIQLTILEWQGIPASLMAIRRTPDLHAAERARALELDVKHREARLRELSSILDTATDGVVVTDDSGRILSLNRSAEALFGYDQRELAGDRFAVLFASESQAVAVEYFESLRANGVASLLNDGREVLGRVRQGGSIPLSMTIGRINDSPDRRFCAVLRDISAAKKTERDLVSARQAAEEASARKSDFLATISHEIRTPLNAIIGFAEIMLEERFGPIGTERYKEYLSDIRASGGHVISLVNDLLDLAKAEAGRMDLSLAGLDLNEIVSRCVGLMQGEAARARIVVRTSFAVKLPQIVGDDRSLRQIVLNLVSNAIRFTEAGGQVIVSTASSDTGEVTVRIRDTGVGMSKEEIEAALEPFRQVATARRSGGTGLGLPLTKALVTANGARLQITSARREGTLVEVVFPPARVLSRERS